jgi:hypothetical protein
MDCFPAIQNEIHKSFLKTFVMLKHNIQGDRKVTQPMLKYLLMFAIQYNSIGLENTISL